MRPIRTALANVGVSPPIPLDHYRQPFNVGIGVSVAAGAAVTFTVEHTFDDVYAPGFNPATATWYANAGLTGKTASMDGTYAFPVTAVRLNITAATTPGTVTMTVVQAGMAGE